MTLAKTIGLLSPELVLLAAGLVILLLDMLWHDHEGKKGWLPYLALAGLGGSLAALIVSWVRMGAGPSLAAAMVRVDAAAITANASTTGGTNRGSLFPSGNGGWCASSGAP